MDYIEALRLRSLNYPVRQMELNLRCSHHTLNAFFALADAQGINWPLEDGVTNEEIQRLLYPQRYEEFQLRYEPDYPYIHKELAKKGVNLTLLHEEYCARAKDAGLIPYRYTQFCFKYRKWARITKATMRIQHKPGDAMQVDWAGATIPIYDSVTGETTEAYLFAAVLPCSCYAYAEVCENMETENWLLCHIHAYRYFGGTTRLLIPDNLTTGVTKNTFYETILNRSYQEMSDYYNTAIVPCRVKRPKDKSLAESSVNFATTWIIAALRDQKFFSINEAKKAVAEKLEDLNTRPFKKLPGNRRSAYENEEKEFMQPLPTQDYEPSIWTLSHVGNDYLITDGKNKYSVPFNLIGEQVNVRLTKHKVEVFYHGARVATHNRSLKVEREAIVNPDHMTPAHRKYLAYNADDFREWAIKVGPNVTKVVEYFLTSGKEVEQGYKPCGSLKKLGSKYDDVLLEDVCKRMLEISNAPTIRNITLLLKNSKTGIVNVKKAAVQSSTRTTNSNNFAFTRGADYFSKGGDLK